MKNIFKLMGVALMACSLMVACGKDEPEPTPEEQIADGMNVTFGEDSWAAGDLQCGYYESYGAILFAGSKVENSMPMFNSIVYATTTGTYTATAGADGFLPDDADIYVCEYYQRTGLTDGTNNYGDWWAAEVTLNIKAVDLTALTVTAVFEGTMLDAAAAYLEEYGQTGIPNAPRCAFKATFGNVSL